MKYIITVIIVAIFFIILLLFPVQTPCKIAGCVLYSPAPDESGNYSIDYDSEPLFVYVIELITKKDFVLKYSTYTVDKNYFDE